MDPLMMDLSRLLESERDSESTRSTAKGSGIPFEELLMTSMKQVNTLQLESDALIQRLAVGDVEDISEVVLASSRAEVALKLFMEVRNKFLDAYQQLSRISS